MIPVRVYLPPCHGLDGREYPSLYLLHGYPYDETHWEQLGVVEVADAHIRDDNWPSFLMVIPFQPQPLFTGTDGGPGSYEEELVQGLMPYIDGTYLTHGEPAARGIAGISRGGVWALEIGLRHPELFGHIAALSPALSFNQARPDYDPLQIAAAGEVADQRILLLAGQEDWAREGTVRLTEILISQGRMPETLLPPGAHADPLWESSMQEVLRFFAGAWLPTADS
jgi:enterochelin esterase-like enzyme